MTVWAFSQPGNSSDTRDGGVQAWFGAENSPCENKKGQCELGMWFPLSQPSLFVQARVAEPNDSQLKRSPFEKETCRFLRIIIGPHKQDS